MIDKDDPIERAKFDTIFARLKDQADAAHKSYMAITRLSVRRYHVTKLSANDGVACWNGTIIFGPATKEECLSFLSRYKGGDL